ncbi:glycosyltransferase family 2 protein [Luteipulveratus mongoliensis]|uniref:glycosyltransferase family 2 protein n=1 Tax=Luteipulveratus mongoliensis TaxID=571913 RepID=UPI0006987804|nr:glycosyltransferase family 2 protein [Luteipulveratus mongoliensis]
MDVSVIVPVYNGLPELQDQLEALSRQTFDGEWELLLVDNASTDGTFDAAQEWVGRLPLRCLRATDRQGPSYARNVGARHAQGEWLAFCDADDVADPAWLERLYAAREGADMVSGAMGVAELNPPWTVLARGPSAVWDELPEGPCDYLPFARSCNVLVRRSAFEALDGFDESLPFLEDVDLSWRGQLAGWTLAVAPTALIHYRYRPTPMGVYRQMANYEGAEVLLYQRFRSQGAQRRPAAVVARKVGWLVVRAPYPLLGPRRRYVWFTMLGGMVGRARGSVRYRTLYL